MASVRSTRSISGRPRQYRCIRSGCVNPAGRDGFCRNCAPNAQYWGDRSDTESIVSVASTATTAVEARRPHSDRLGYNPQRPRASSDASGGHSDDGASSVASYATVARPRPGSSSAPRQDPWARVKRETNKGPAGRDTDVASEYSEYGGGTLNSARGSEYSDAPRSARRRYEPQAPPRTPRENALEDENEYLKEQLAAAEARGVQLRDEAYEPRRRSRRRDDDRRRRSRDRDYEDEPRRRRSRRRDHEDDRDDRRRRRSRSRDYPDHDSRAGTAGATYGDSYSDARRRRSRPADEEEGPTAAELAYERSLEDYKRQTGKTPKNADMSRRRRSPDRTPRSRRPRPDGTARPALGRRPPPPNRARHLTSQSEDPVRRRSEMDNPEDWRRAKTPDSPKAAEAFFQRERPGSSVPDMKRAPPPARKFVAPPNTDQTLWAHGADSPQRDASQVATLVDMGDDDDSEDDDDQPGAPPIHMICRTPTGMTIPVNARPGWRCEAIVRRVGKAIGLQSDVIRLVAGERPLDAMRRVRDAQLAPGDRLRVALVGGPHTPCGPCLHQWVRAVQVNGADVRIGGRDGRWLTHDAFDHITTAVVGPDRRARVVVTLHSTETAHNLQLPWGRVEPRRGGSCTDVVPKKLGKCLALARARNRRRDRDGGGPHHVDLLDARPDDATTGHRGGPTQGELDHRQRQGFGFRYDYFGARQITLQFANVQPDVEYLFGLSKLGDRRGVLSHDDYKHTDWGDGFRDPCCWRVVFTRARGFDVPGYNGDVYNPQPVPQFAPSMMVPPKQSAGTPQVTCCSVS